VFWYHRGNQINRLLWYHRGDWCLVPPGGPGKKSYFLFFEGGCPPCVARRDKIVGLDNWQPCEGVLRGCATIGAAKSPSWHCVEDKSGGDDFVDCSFDMAAMNSPFLKIAPCDFQAPVLKSTLMTVFDDDAEKGLPSVMRERSEGVAFQHFSRQPSPRLALGWPVEFPRSLA
jgi:hypothetical protein